MMATSGFGRNLPQKPFPEEERADVVSMGCFPIAAGQSLQTIPRGKQPVHPIRRLGVDPSLAVW
jgi:hypothetical protein